jgi:hypothetical protein
MYGFCNYSTGSQLARVWATEVTSEMPFPASVLSTEAPNSPEHRLPGSCALCHQVDDKGAEIGLLLGIATAGIAPRRVTLADADRAMR